MEVSSPIRASMRPPDLPGGNSGHHPQRYLRHPASMRPPDLPGGNEVTMADRHLALRGASMRPPDLPGGNLSLKAQWPWGSVTLQ